jgi:sedoheptulose-bisphosphatase
VISFFNLDNKWIVTKNNCEIKPNCKIFAPGNLRASNEDIKYRNLINYWIDNRYTLRYTGGMVPDIYQIFIKGEGIFVNLPSQKAPSKLRYYNVLA